MKNLDIEISLSHAIPIELADSTAMYAALQKAGDVIKNRGTAMSGYGQIFIKEGGSGEAWCVLGDGDEKGHSDFVRKTLSAIPGIDEVKCEPEAFPPRDGTWMQVYPKKKLWKKKDISLVNEKTPDILKLYPDARKLNVIVLSNGERWITTHGQAIQIKDGEDVDSAIKSHFSKPENSEEGKLKAAKAATDNAGLLSRAANQKNDEESHRIAKEAHQRASASWRGFAKQFPQRAKSVGATSLANIHDKAADKHASHENDMKASRLKAAEHEKHKEALHLNNPNQVTSYDLWLNMALSQHSLSLADNGLRWITVHGQPIPIKNGEDIGDAIKQHFSGLKGKDGKPVDVRKNDKAPSGHKSIQAPKTLSDLSKHASYFAKKALVYAGKIPDKILDKAGGIVKDAVHSMYNKGSGSRWARGVLGAMLVAGGMELAGVGEEHELPKHLHVEDPSVEYREEHALIMSGLRILKGAGGVSAELSLSDDATDADVSKILMEGKKLWDSVKAKMKLKKLSLSNESNSGTHNLKTSYDLYLSSFLNDKSLILSNPNHDEHGRFSSAESQDASEEAERASSWAREGAKDNAKAAALHRKAADMWRNTDSDFSIARATDHDKRAEFHEAKVKKINAKNANNRGRGEVYKDLGMKRGSAGYE